MTRGDTGKAQDQRGRGNGSYQAGRIRLIPFSEIVLGTERRDTVKALIPREGLVVVWGPPKCGKSFLVFDLCMHVALGWVYRGRRVDVGDVVYCAFEGVQGLRARVEAFRQRYLSRHSAEVGFYLQPETLDLVQDHYALIAAIREHCIPSIVILDTLNRSLRGSESKDEDMAAYIRAADSIREAFHCTVIIVHHCGVDSSRPRGHTSLSAAADVQIAIRRDAGANIIATVEFNKDGPGGDALCSRLEAINVGVDEDGEPITSCIVVPIDPTTATRRMPTGQAELALRLLHRAMVDVGEAPPVSKHIPAGQKTVVRLDVWRRYFADGIAANRTSKDTKQKAFRRAVATLQESGFIGVWGDFVWPTQDNGHPGH